MRRAAVAVAVLAACQDAQISGDALAVPDAQASCAATLMPALVDRKLLGAGAAYPADGALRGRVDELAGDLQRRRDVAWHTVAKVLAPVRLAGLAADLPSFQTWYGKEDVIRVFGKLFAAIDPQDRRSRRRFGDAELDAAFLWNVDAVDALWPEERVDAYARALVRAEDIAGLGGIARVSYSPAAARHLVGSYPELLACLEHGAPGRFLDGPTTGTRELRREVVALGHCAQRRSGPFFVATGEQLTASLPGADLVVRDTAADRCHRRDACTVTGPGTFDVEVTGPAAGTLAVSYAAPSVPWAPCLSGPFSGDAVLVKADWRRVLPGMTLPVHDTDAAALPRDAWDETGSQADPAPDAIYTLRLPQTDQVYRLAALHIMTKELDHWLWITLWWSPSPNDDFGADRPASLTGVFANYKMCAVSDFAERDPRRDGGYAGALGAAAAATHDQRSWCSNPFLEQGKGNARTNCVGCHQHGGSDVASDDIVADPAQFPDHGRIQVRNNFPGDYVFATRTGDDLSRAFADIVTYWTQ